MLDDSQIQVESLPPGPPFDTQRLAVYFTLKLINQTVNHAQYPSREPPHLAASTGGSSTPTATQGVPPWPQKAASHRSPCRTWWLPAPTTRRATWCFARGPNPST